MSHIGQWKVDLFLFDDDTEVTAKAVLHTDAARPVEGRGSARLPAGEDVPEIEAELAASRALAALGTRLLEVTTDDLRAPAEPDREPDRGRYRRAGREGG
jgi:hypothetical protein